MKIYNNNLFIPLVFICVFIFAFYNIISPVYNSSLIIEGYDNNSSSVAGADAEGGDDDVNGDTGMYTGDASNSNPFDRTISMIHPKCQVFQVCLGKSVF